MEKLKSACDSGSIIDAWFQEHFHNHSGFDVQSYNRMSAAKEKLKTLFEKTESENSNTLNPKE